MSNKTLQMTEQLGRYLIETGCRESDVLTRLRTETAQRQDFIMQIAPEQGQFMALLVQLVNARRIIEVGVFTGYSSLAIADVLPDDGYILACDINPDTTAIARRYWQAAEKLTCSWRPLWKP